MVEWHQKHKGGDQVSGKSWRSKLQQYVELSSPVTLGFAFISLIALGLSAITGGASNRALFSVYRASAADPLSYLRIFLHPLGHADFSHYANNMALFLVLGPLVEKHYGSRKLLIMLVVTALVGGLAHLLLSPNTAGLGASGLVFMLILLSAISGRSQNKLPLTLILVAIIYLGGELTDALFKKDNISQLAHITGGICGIVFGLIWKKGDSSGSNW